MAWHQTQDLLSNRGFLRPKDWGRLADAAKMAKKAMVSSATGAGSRRSRLGKLMGLELDISSSNLIYMIYGGCAYNNMA